MSLKYDKYGNHVQMMPWKNTTVDFAPTTYRNLKLQNLSYISDQLEQLMFPKNSFSSRRVYGIVNRISPISENLHLEGGNSSPTYLNLKWITLLC